MRTRAAAALHKVLTFQDVRTRVGDVAPSTVAPLVRLLRQDGSSDKGRQAARDRSPATAAAPPETKSDRGELQQPQRCGELHGILVNDEDKSVGAELPSDHSVSTVLGRRCRGVWTRCPMWCCFRSDCAFHSSSDVS